MGPDQEPVASYSSATTLGEAVDELVEHASRLPETPGTNLRVANAARRVASLTGRSQWPAGTEVPDGYVAPELTDLGVAGVLVPLEVARCAVELAENLGKLKVLGQAPLGVTWQGEHLASVVQGPGGPIIAFGRDPDAALKEFWDYQNADRSFA